MIQIIIVALQFILIAMLSFILVLVGAHNFSIGVDTVSMGVVINVIYVFVVSIYKYDGRLGLFSFLIITISIFIFGRHFSFFLTSENVLFWDFFGGIYLTENNFSYSTILALIFLNSLVLGFSLLSSRGGINEAVNALPVSSFVVNGLVLLTVSLFFPFFIKMLLGYISDGYVGIYLAMQNAIQTGDITFRLYSLSYTLLLICIGLSVAAKKLYLTRFCFLLLFVRASSLLVMGQRAYFFCVILFIIMYYLSLKKLDLNKSIQSVALFLILINLSQYILVVRSGGDFSFFIDNYKISESIGRFLYSQGVTFFVFSISFELSDYPILPWFQNFLPGASFVHGILFGASPATEQSYAHFLSYYVNNSEYLDGFGLGWTFLSDIMLFTPLFREINLIIFTILFGAFFRYIELNSNKSYYSAFYLTTIAIPFLYLPRSGLNSVFPLMVYATVILLLATKNEKRIVHHSTRNGI